MLNGCEEAQRKFITVLLEEMLDAFVPRGTHDEAGVVVLFDADDDLGIVERFCVEVGGLGKAQDAAGVALRELRDSVGLPAQVGNFKTRPLPP